MFRKKKNNKYNKYTKQHNEDEDILKRVLGDLQDAIEGNNENIEVNVVKLNKNNSKHKKDWSIDKIGDPTVEDLKILKNKIRKDSLTNGEADEKMFRGAVDSYINLIKTLDRPIRHGAAFVITEENKLVMSSINIDNPEEAIKVYEGVIEAIKQEFNVE